MPTSFDINDYDENLLEDSFRDALDKIAELEAEVAEKDDEISNLEDKVAEFENEVELWKDRESELQSEVKDLEEQVKTLEEELREVENEPVGIEFLIQYAELLNQDMNNRHLTKYTELFRITGV